MGSETTSNNSKTSPTSLKNSDHNDYHDTDALSLEQSLQQVPSSPPLNNAAVKPVASTLARHRSISRGRRRAEESASAHMRRSMQRQNSHQDDDANERARRRRSTSRRRAASRHRSNRSLNLSSPSLKVDDIGDNEDNNKSMHRSNSSLKSISSRTRRSRPGQRNVVHRTSRERRGHLGMMIST